MKRFFVIFTIAIIATNTVLAQTTLPEGVWHPRFIFGTVKEISSEFNNEGELNSIGRFNQTFNSDFLKKYIEEIGTLVDVFNMYSPGYNIGDRFNLGRLEFSGGLNISYFVPALGYGISDKWTVGVALPIVTLRGDIGIVQEGDNNANSIRRMIARDGVDIGEEGSAFSKNFDRLINIDLIKEFNRRTGEMGYDPISNRNRKGLGDLQILSAYNYLNKQPMNFYFLSTLNLPTGIEPNPDDLISLNEFNKLFFNLKSYHNFNVRPNLILGTALGTTINLPNKITKRVPKDSLDILPEEDRKEELTVYYGNGYSLDLYSQYDLMDFLTLEGNLSYNFKYKDRYKGRKFSDYSLLSNNTSAKSFTVKMGITFNTSKWFMKHKFSFPFMINYNYSDVLAGLNAIRQSRQEISILLFF